MSLRIRYLTLALSLLYFSSTWASSGDQAYEYRTCVSRCNSELCLFTSTWQPSLALRLTGWTCIDDCKYSCMHLITAEKIKHGNEIHQYHGKWPFWRWAGMQEPASVAFSLFNLFFHVKGARRIQRVLPVDHPMRWYYVASAIVSINAWIWSAVFHTRDLPLTEKLDYFSAAAAIIFALYYTVIRLFHLYTVKSDRYSTRSATHTRRPRTFWALVCCAAFFGHVSYLVLLPRFDYTYNIVFNLAIGIIHNLLWTLFSFPSSIPIIRRFLSRPRSYRPRYAYKTLVFVLLTTAATALELFDFSPWMLAVDAHALWHLSTAPIIAFWYDFLIEDAMCEGWTRRTE